MVEGWSVVVRGGQWWPVSGPWMIIKWSVSGHLMISGEWSEHWSVRMSIRWMIEVLLLFKPQPL